MDLRSKVNVNIKNVCQHCNIYKNIFSIKIGLSYASASKKCKKVLLYKLAKVCAGLASVQQRHRGFPWQMLKSKWKDNNKGEKRYHMHKTSFNAVLMGTE